MTRRPLWVYVLATAVVWAILLTCLSIWDPSRFRAALIFCGGFYVGLLAMYVAVHVYRWQ